MLIVFINPLGSLDHIGRDQFGVSVGARRPQRLLRPPFRSLHRRAWPHVHREQIAHENIRLPKSVRPGRRPQRPASIVPQSIRQSLHGPAHACRPLVRCLTSLSVRSRATSLASYDRLQRAHLARRHGAQTLGHTRLPMGV